MIRRSILNLRRLRSTRLTEFLNTSLARKASGVWTSKMGKGHDIEHPTLAALEGATMGRVVKIMSRRWKDGKRVLE